MNRRDTLGAMLGLPMVVAAVGYAEHHARVANGGGGGGAAAGLVTDPASVDHADDEPFRHVTINVVGSGGLSRADLRRVLDDLQGWNPGVRIVGQ